MLQRAASNAYSWWWASHIRTKQSKWLEQSLQDMEEKVQHVIKLIEEDGDSFAKRAEMYYKKRPELLHFVEEAYRAFRALAERYDHLSNDLQKANHTIATVFPEQVQFAIDEDDDCSPLKIPKNPQVPPENVPKVVPKAPSKDSKALLTSASKKFPAKKLLKTEGSAKNVVKSGLSKSEALEEIDKLQKEILALQTVKEFVKSSYEIGLEKYWGIENQIMEMQQKVCSLQDEFGVNMVIEDDEARTLMAKAALQSCQETLVQLLEKQEKSAQDAREEYDKIEDIRLRIESLKNEYLPGEIDGLKSSTEELDHTIQESRENDTTVDVVGSLESRTVSELVEKIDELAHKVINLETEVSSQTVLINTLRTEVDDLQTQIRSLEAENDSGLDGNCTLISKVKEMDDKFHMIEDLNKKVEKQNSNLEIKFVKACSSLDHLSEKLTSIELDEEEVEVSNKLHLQDEEMKTENTKDAREEDKKEQALDEQVCIEQESEEVNLRTMKLEDTKDVREEDTDNHHESVCNKQGEGEENAKESMEQVTVEHSNKKGEVDELEWQQKLLNGMEDREKILLTEYTTILRNFKDVKRKLSDMEKKDLESQSETQVQVQQLRDSISKRDEEIQHLRQKLNHLQATFSKSTSSEDRGISSLAEEDDIKFVLIDQAPAISAAEEKLRMDIDAILDENLDFWLRFSTSFHLIQKFQAEVQDLQNEVSKMEEKNRVVTEVKSEVRPIYKHLREIQTELTMWLEQSVSLKEELKRRLESLCSIQEQITIALKEGVEEDEIKFSSHQAAKFQGEVVNMKQENNKVSEELQAGVDHVDALQQEIEKTLRKLNEEFDIQSDQARPPQSESRPRIPLRSFIFGTKQKKQKHSIFSAVLLNRRYHQAPRDGGPL